MSLIAAFWISIIKTARLTYDMALPHRGPFHHRFGAQLQEIMDGAWLNIHNKKRIDNTHFEHVATV